MTFQSTVDYIHDYTLEEYNVAEKALSPSDISVFVKSAQWLLMCW